MLSQKAKYALRALLVLAQHDTDQPIFVADIADRENLPRKFLELILLDLKRAGFVDSRRGKNGGYLLAKRPGDITLGDVLRVVDGPLALVPCASDSAYRRCPDCHEETTCAIRRVMRQVRDATSGILDKTTLADLLPGGDDNSRLENVIGVGFAA
ncbi:MAG TPA: Rrf2 family transcriptional regulator [Alphaproteobacteria bacterium]|nr:Rrf2 family transcriptional regulator [Alphaproteobacteria bacterium]